jgi:sulfite exporter TauE/SafE/copper chaperone CopZ
MHCPSCSLIIERTLLKLPGITNATASVSTNTVTVEYEGKEPECNRLNELLADKGYELHELSTAARPFSVQNYWKPAILVIAISVLFYVIAGRGISPPVMVSGDSGYGAFLLFGLLAGVSSCAALTGSIVLTGTARWLEKHGNRKGLTANIRPHLFFNSGRILSYGLFGALLGYAGESVRISPVIYNASIMAVSIMIIGLSLRIAGFSSLSHLSLPLPETLSRIVRNIGNGRWTFDPFTTGFLTLFIPCGFTLIAEGAAVLSGNVLHGMLMMVCFVIGTMPALLGIGMLSSKLSTNGKTAPIFLKTSGIVVLCFVIWNLVVQFGPQTGITGPRASAPVPAVPPPQNSVLLSTVYSDARDISPNNFTVKKGQKVRLEVYPVETSYGCMSTILVPGLWDRPEPIVKGKKIVMQFTPEKAGSYRITCAMGVPRGVIVVK